MVSDVRVSAPEPAECVREKMTANDRIPQVLVVDDEPNIRELVQVALKFHGCAVSTAASGMDALR
jgi:response regulator RpfG family c-di-GMP phosphodiesterase